MRYRGYYYDSESELYYLQTRFYAPELGRFISPDAYGSTGQGILGNNFFAYCGNNPVKFIDPHGKRRVALSELRGGGPIRPFDDTESNENLWQTIKNFGNNEDEDVVLNAEFLTFYKGTLVVKAPIGRNAFSFGIIFLGNDVNQRSDAKETVQHEYGHAVHFSQVGADNYLLYVAVPSLIGYWTGVDYKDYFSQPYENTAEMFGGVQREYNGAPYSYSCGTKEWVAYWIFTIFAP